jgi:hypothetical protein
MSLKQMQILDSALTKPVMTITKEGIWVDPSLAVDETAKAVLASLETQIKNMVQMAVAKEREACAKVCDEFESDTDPDAGAVLAAAIRARGEQA